MQIKTKPNYLEIMKVWKQTQTVEVDTLARKIERAAEADGHEINNDDFSDMLFQAFKAGYLAGSPK